MPEGNSISLTREERIELYAARRLIGSDLEKKLKVRIPLGVYFQDPLVAANHAASLDPEFYVPWEPGLADGPTSARFAVVDYDGDAETLHPPARWDSRLDCFVDTAGSPISAKAPQVLQFHQLHAWAIVQNALDLYESGFGLGRRIPWGFEGNRLIVVPHAGYGENAYYDRQSKSLQFYYFDHRGKRIHTCLSADIVYHEFGHAMLDGIRPYYIEAVLPETAAFHEFIGDLTAILLSFRNNAFRRMVLTETSGDLSVESALNRIAEQFGEAVQGRPYLRSALNKLEMHDVRDDQRPHRMSEVLTGAMFDIVRHLSRHYVETRRHTPAQAYWFTIQRMQSMAIQPLDLLPPVDVSFRDYARAVLRAEELANPTDPDDHRRMMLEVFRDRGILDQADQEAHTIPRHIFERLPLDVFHDVETIAASRAEAYRFLDDNRRKLFIPPNVDIVVADLYTAQKLTREARRAPRQTVLAYLWREDVALEGARFGRFAGQTASLLCGGTLALDQNGGVLAWARKPGSQPAGSGNAADAEAEEGSKRRAAFLEALARRIGSGRIGQAPGGERGLVSGRIPPFTSRLVDGAIRFELSPHFSIHDDDDEDTSGSRRWQISS
jgi:hypothetical protein